MDKRLDKIVKKISEDMNIPKWKVELVVMHQFKTLRDVISKGDFEKMRLRYIGQFRPSITKLKRREERLKKGSDE